MTQHLGQAPILFTEWKPRASKRRLMLTHSSQLMSTTVCSESKWFYFSIIIGSLMSSRWEEAAGLQKATDICTHGPTIVSVYWLHHAKKHIDKWVLICNKAGINIEAATISKYILNYWPKTGDNDSGPTSAGKHYSKAGLINAILEWIVADDQICPIILCLWLWFLTIHYTIQLLQVVNCPELQNIF